MNCTMISRYHNNAHQRSQSDVTCYYSRGTKMMNGMDHLWDVHYKRHCSFENDHKTMVEQDEEDNSSNYISNFLEHLDAVYSRYSPAVVLQNKGNTARDHLANERTFLAWFRTSLSLITVGIGIIQIYHASTTHHKRLGRALGLIFVMAGIVFLYFGNVRYFHTQCALQHGNFPASRGVITWASFYILFLFVGLFTVMVLESKMQ